MKETLIILGAGGSAQQVFWLINRLRKYDIAGFYDEKIESDEILLGLPVRRSVEELASSTKGRVRLISAVGDIYLRERWHNEFGSRFEYATLIDPNALIAPNAEIGKDVVIHAFTTVSMNATVGDSTYISWNCLVAHDVKIGKFSQISPGTQITGRCQVGDFCQLGTNCSLLPDRIVGSGSIVGAGAVVNNDIPKNALAVGVPAVVKRIIA